MNQYKVVYRELINGAWGEEKWRFVVVDNLMKARAAVINKDIIIERIIRA